MPRRRVQSAACWYYRNKKSPGRGLFDNDYAFFNKRQLRLRQRAKNVTPVNIPANTTINQVVAGAAGENSYIVRPLHSGSALSAWQVSQNGGFRVAITNTEMPYRALLSASCGADLLTLYSHQK